MLNSLQGISPQVAMNSVCAPAYPLESKYNRNEMEDMKKAIEYLYEFKKKLDELHPHCITMMENLLQSKNRF